MADVRTSAGVGGADLTARPRITASATSSAATANPAPAANAVPQPIHTDARAELLNRNDQIVLGLVAVNLIGLRNP